jgi:hypothetical protein
MMKQSMFGMTEEIDSSHAAVLSNPRDVAAFIESAAK